MKKLFVVIGIVVVLLVLAFAIIALRSPKQPATTSQGNVTFPTASSTPISSATGNAHTFLQDPDVKEDATNPGYYYLGYQPSAGQQTNPPYLIEYIAETQYFGITIMQEPIGENRRAAEQYLQQKLSLTQEQMCSLKYTVGVPDSVNAQYSDVNLGFSFCPGAVRLPQ